MISDDIRAYLLPRAFNAAVRAGAEIMKIYTGGDNYYIAVKSDHTPITIADRLAQGCEVVVVAYDMSALMVVELLSRGARQCLSLPSSPSVLRRKLLDL